jgi:cell division protein ZapA
MEEMIPVNILIGDRTYRIRIDPADEEQVRTTLKTINEKIIEFKTQFAGKDMQDYIAMVMIWHATQPAAALSAQTQHKEWVESLSRMEQLIDNAL